MVLSEILRQPPPPRYNLLPYPPHSSQLRKPSCLMLVKPNNKMSQRVIWAMMGATLGLSITRVMKQMTVVTFTAAKQEKADEGK